MFWNLNKENISTEIFKEEGIKKILIATAFISPFGVEFLKKIQRKFSLKRDDFQVYLSHKFSSKNITQILRELTEFTEVSIINLPKEKNGYFHGKICLYTNLEDKKKIIIGSSNYTKGGIENNFEINIIKELEQNDIKSESALKIVLENYAKRVTTETIEAYQEIEERIAEISKITENFEKIFLFPFNKGDIFSESHYNLTNQYFQFESYETIFPKNAPLNSVPSRKTLQNQFLKLNEQLNSFMNQNNLYHHKMEQHITSSIFPNEFNRFYVDWLGIRYGKKGSEIDNLNKGLEENDLFLGFQKHSCVQISLFQTNFFIGIWHAVPNNAIDRMFLKEKIKEATFKLKLISILKKFEGSNYYWSIGDQIFEMKNSFATDFIDFYIKYDQEGVHTSFGIDFSPDDPKISTKNIIQTIKEETTKLIEIYNLVTKRYN